MWVTSMTVYLYRYKNKYYVSPVYLHNEDFEQIETYNLDLESTSYSNLVKESTVHILNNCLSIPTRHAMYLVIDKSKKVRIFEKFRVLHTYHIHPDDLVFEIYYINQAIKIFYGSQFEPKQYYHICLSCGTMHTDLITVCIECKKTYCNSCNLTFLDLCNDCDLGALIDSDSDSEITF